MKEFFVEKIETYFKGYHVGTDCQTVLLEEKEAQNKEIAVTWDNIHRLYECYYERLNFDLVSYKKGLVVSLYRKPKWSKEPKQWIDSEPNIILKISYKIKQNVSFNEIFGWTSADEAAEYIKDHYPFFAVNRVISAYRANEKITNDI